jgi:hypothetical protein
MRYFPHVKAEVLNDNAQKFDASAARKFSAATSRGLRNYHRHLETIAHRLEAKAYRFFRFGFAETGLHDGLLLSLSIGDAIGWPEERISKLQFGKGKSIVEMQVLNYERDTLHSFRFRKLKKVVFDVPSATPLWFKPGRTLGHIYSYEIVSVSPKYLRTEWLLDSGGTIIVEFEKLDYHRKLLMS